MNNRYASNRHTFAPHQHAAFALSSNQASEINFDHIIKSQHFFDLVEKGALISLKIPLKNLFVKSGIFRHIIFIIRCHN